MSKQSGFLVIIAGPSGVGKGSIIKSLIDKPELKLNFSISATTRKIRNDEKEGVNYFFKSKNEFEKMIQNDEFLEYAIYVDNYYGTPLFNVKEMLERGENVLLEIECQGVLQVIKKMPSALTIFIKPPSQKELERRLIHRGSENLEVIKNRLKQACNEYEHLHLFKHVVINKDLNITIDKISEIIWKQIQHR